MPKRAKLTVRIDVPSHTNICFFLHQVMGGGENLTRTSMNARVRLKRGYLTQLIIAATHPHGSKTSGQDRSAIAEFRPA